MDSSLINLIPNLFSRRKRSAPPSHSEPVSPPSQPELSSPPSTAQQSHSLEKTSITIPLRVKWIGPRAAKESHELQLVSSYDEVIELRADATYSEFLSIVQRMLKAHRMEWHFDGRSFRFYIGAVAMEGKRSELRRMQELVDVDEPSWERVLYGLRGRRLVELVVFCCEMCEVDNVRGEVVYPVYEEGREKDGYRELSSLGADSECVRRQPM